MIGAQRGLYTYIPTRVGDKVVMNYHRWHIPEFVGEKEVNNQRGLHFPEIVGDNNITNECRCQFPDAVKLLLGLICLRCYIYYIRRSGTCVMRYMYQISEPLRELWVHNERHILIFNYYLSLMSIKCRCCWDLENIAPDPLGRLG